MRAIVLEMAYQQRGNCWDNAPMERLFRSLEREWLPVIGYASVTDVWWGISHYLMRVYNQQRPHQYIEGQSWPQESAQGDKWTGGLIRA